MQQIEELICPECQMMFNENDNLPLMLPDCGHTICQNCIQQMLINKKYIVCPEDGINQYIINLPISWPKIKMISHNFQKTVNCQKWWSNI